MLCCVVYIYGKKNIIKGNGDHHRTMISNNEDTLLDCIMEDTPPHKIKHLVCSGGGTFGFIAYGVFKQSCLDGFWKMSDIESMYGTSVGAILCLLFSFMRNGDITWEILDNYLINRPWQNVFNIDIYSVSNSLQNGGILNKESIEDVFVPLLRALDIPKNITLQQHYELFGIELHVYSTDLDAMEPVDISYKTHPEMRVLDAVYASCSLPLLFSPCIQEQKTYFDGGLFCNYPLYFCMQNEKVKNSDEIMGLKCITGSSGQSPEALHLDSNDSASQSLLFDYILSIFRNLTTKIRDYESCSKILHQFNIPSPELSIYDIYLAIMSSEKRRQMMEDGVAFWKERVSLKRIL